MWNYSWKVSEKLASRQQSIADNICNLCGEQILSFRDEVSEKEYRISAMCQNCQDDLFEEDPYTESEDGS